MNITSIFLTINHKFGAIFTFVLGFLANALAIIVVIVLFPTPPLPERTMICIIFKTSNQPQSTIREIKLYGFTLCLTSDNRCSIFLVTFGSCTEAFPDAQVCWLGHPFLSKLNHLKHYINQQYPKDNRKTNSTFTTGRFPCQITI